MPTYRIPLDDEEALKKLEGVEVKKWNVLLPDGIVEVETGKAVKGLGGYKV